VRRREREREIQGSREAEIRRESEGERKRALCKRARKSAVRDSERARERE
jgi:hypothetical protein